MKFILLILLFINPIDDLNKVAKVNDLKKEAKAAYIEGDFGKAVATYEKLVNEFGVQEESVLLNLAHSYYGNKAPDKARELYNQLSLSADKRIASSALNQIGLLSYQQQQKEEAIRYFKEAMKANSANEEARFNYTKLKKEIEEEKQQNQEQNKDQNQENKDKEQKDQQDKSSSEQKDQQQQQEQKQQEENSEEKEGQNEDEQQEKEEQGEPGEEEQDEQQQSTAEKLKEMNMSEEKAQMILEAMKNNEIQYIQQNQRKPRSKADDGKPDW